MARPTVKRQAVGYILDHYGASTQRACGLVKQARSTYYYRSVKDPQTALRHRMREMAQLRVRYGYRRLHVLLKREGWRLSKNRVYRLYAEEQLQLRSQLPKRRKMVVSRRERYEPKRPNEVWSLDFVADQLADGTRLRALTVVDVFSREGLAIEVGYRLRAEHVVAVLNGLVAQRRAPRFVRADNGSEFSGRLFDMWAYHHKVQIDFSRPGKPTDNSFIETFNGSLRDECLNLHWFESLAQAKREIEAWRQDYNESRPHMALNDLTPDEFARKYSVRQPAERSTSVID